MNRTLGLFSVCSIACGTMLAGVFVLPGYAAEIGGPSVYLAFLLAGLLFLPAAMSQAEMSTALPDSGGIFNFVDRSLGPVFGTISGLGVWMLFILKTAIALAGLGAYVAILIPELSAYRIETAGIMGLILLLINIIGAKNTGFLRNILVVLSFVVLIIFVERGAFRVSQSNYSPFFGKGVGGFLSATVFVFMSYAGLTKIPMVAEEIKSPSRNIPLGILLSLGLMMGLFVLIAYVYVGLVAPDQYGQSANIIYRNAPLSQAAMTFKIGWFRGLLSIVALLSLVSMVNAGLLISSKIPQAMSRYQQLPEIFSRINSFLGTPVPSFLFTGSVTILALLLLPVIQLAKLASGILLILVSIINASVIIFRESEIEWYRPSFTSPLYPYLQIVGILAPIAIFPFVGLLTVATTGGLILAGLGWYFLFVREKVERSATLSRMFTTNNSFDSTTQAESAVLGEDHRDQIILIPFFNLRRSNLLEAQKRIESALALFGDDYTFEVLHLHEVADPTNMSEDTQLEPTEVDLLLRRYVERLNRGGTHRLMFSMVRTSRSRSLVRNFCEEQPVAYTLLKWTQNPSWSFLVFKSNWWLEDFPSDLILIRNSISEQVGSVQILSNCFPDSGQQGVVSTGLSISHSTADEVRVILTGSASQKDLPNHMLADYEEDFSKFADREIKVEFLGRDNIGRLQNSQNSDGLLIVDENFPFSKFETENRSTRPIIKCISSKEDDSLKNDPFSEIENKLSSDNIYLNSWKPLSKRALYHEIARVSETSSNSANQIEKGLWDTEKLYSTYRGGGVAIPHARISGVQKSTVLFFQLDRAVSYTVSDEEVKLCFVVIGGSHSGEVNSLVRSVDQILKYSGKIDELMKAPDAKSVIKILRSGRDTLTTVTR